MATPTSVVRTGTGAAFVAAGAIGGFLAGMGIQRLIRERADAKEDEDAGIPTDQRRKIAAATWVLIVIGFGLLLAAVLGLLFWAAQNCPSELA